MHQKLTKKHFKALLAFCFQNLLISQMFWEKEKWYFLLVQDSQWVQWCDTTANNPNISDQFLLSSGSSGEIYWAERGAADTTIKTNIV